MKLRKPSGLRRWSAMALAAVMMIASPLMSGCGSNSSGAQTPVNWDMYNTFPVATAPNVVGVERILKAVHKKTNGRVTVKLHLGGSLPIQTDQITNAVSNDVVEMGDDAFFSGNVPIVGLLRLPLLVRNYADYKKALAIMEPYVKRAYAQKGIVYLGSYSYPMQYLFSSKKLTSLADLKGQKIRPSSPQQGQLIQDFGGVPVALGADEVPVALQRGTIDGVVTASDPGGVNWKDSLKYIYTLPFNYGNSNIIVNANEFNKLSPHDQKVLRVVVQSRVRKISNTLNTQNGADTKKLADGGLIWTKPSGEDMSAALRDMAPYWKKWAEGVGPTAVQALNKVKKALGR